MKSILCSIALIFVLSPSSLFSQPAPSGLAADYNAERDYVDLSWEIGDVDPSPNYYYIHRKIDDGQFDIYMATVALDFQDKWVERGHTYGYRISAVYPDDSQSGKTSAVSVSIPRGSSGGGGGGDEEEEDPDEEEEPDEPDDEETATFAPPRDLDGWSENGGIRLEWLSPYSDLTPESYRVYKRVHGNKYAFLAETEDTTYKDSDVKKNKKYRYFVTAVYKDSVNHESCRSNTVQVKAGKKPDGKKVKIKFASEPPHHATVGEELVYQPVVETKPKDVQVCFKLLWGPEDLTMDSTNGQITWTPTEKGRVCVVIQAVVCAPGKKGSATQEFEIKVLPAGSGTISGTVSNEDGEPLEAVEVTLYGSGKHKEKGGKHGRDWDRETWTDADGKYQFDDVRPGKYYMRADSPDKAYHDVWYDGARKSKDADRVRVGEDSSVVIDFVLPFKKGHGNDVTVTGIVTDSASQPIAGAKVKFFKQKPHEPQAGLVGDDEIDGDHSDHRKKGGDKEGVTDSTGAYSVRVREGDYIVRAKAKGYLEQWWDGQETPYEAFVVSLHEDTSGINFSLVPKPEGCDGADGVKASVDILFVGQGGSQSLIVAGRPAKHAPDRLMFLPPVPPDGAFDVRFASGSWVESMPARAAQDGNPGRLAILVQSGGGPLTISWDGPDNATVYTLYDDWGKKVASSSDGPSTILAGEHATYYLETGSGDGIPTTFRMYQNYPNPFNPVTKIAYDLPEASAVQVKIYNAIGQLVATLLSEEKAAGAHQVEWDGANFATGMYLARVEAVIIAKPSETFSSTIKMLLVK